MNYWHETTFVVERCADIRREVASHRQVLLAQSDRNWFAQQMLSLGLWLVAVGERLCHRYEMTETQSAFTGI